MAKHLRIIMLETSAGAQGLRRARACYDVEADEARRMIEAGQAYEAPKGTELGDVKLPGQPVLDQVQEAPAATSSTPAPAEPSSTDEAPAASSAPAKPAKRKATKGGTRKRATRK